MRKKKAPGKEKRKKKKGQKKRGGETTKKPRVRVSSLSPLDVQSALTDAAAVSHSDSVDVCSRITAKVFDARVSARAVLSRKKNRRMSASNSTRVNGRTKS